jgi:E3 SUMO-protein ligase PIAS1
MPTYAPRGGAPLHNSYSSKRVRRYNGRESDKRAGQVTFKDSPFYHIKRPLTAVTECKGESRSSGTCRRLADWIAARESTRDTARVNIDLPPDVADLLNKDADYRVMVFCASDVAAPTPTDISFPHQVELKCNTNEVKANLRGLKNKPGSTRPADITSFIKKKIPGYQNVLEMVYALTSKVRASTQT